MSSLLVLLTLACVTFAAAPAFAEDAKVEKEAKDLQKKAIEDDYLSSDFDKATKKLNDALKKCGDAKCTPKTRSELLRDLGAMQILSKKVDEGQANFLEALKLDRELQLDPNYKTPALEGLWDQTKKKLPAAPTGPGPTDPKTPATGGAQPTGDFIHTPFPAQQVRTPLPVYVEYPGSETIAKVLLKYKGFGMTDFKSVELTKMGKGWGGTIPCADVTQGELKYYVQGFSASNDAVATSGNRNETFKVAIQHEAVADAPSLPGVSAPKQCEDKGDCPPDFPGCHKPEETGGTKLEGEACDYDNECKSNRCKKDKCTAPEDDGTSPVSGKPAKIWIGGGLQVDDLFLPSGENVCKLGSDATPVNTAGYYCTNSDGTDYPSRTARAENDRLVTGGKYDKVDGGGAIGNIRLMVAFDYAVTTNLLLGARIGFVLRTFPGEAAKNDGKAFFGPLHLEARGTFVFGKDALAKAGFAPYAMLGLGAADWNAKVDVKVQQCPSGSVWATDQCVVAPPATPPVGAGAPALRDVQAWSVGGPFFFSIGGGARYAFTPKAAIMGGVKFNGAVGNGGLLPSISPEISAQFGF